MTPHPSESHSISLFPCVDRGVVGHIDTHTHTHICASTEEYFSGGACDLISAWCDDIIRRRRGPSSFEREIYKAEKGIRVPHMYCQCLARAGRGRLHHRGPQGCTVTLALRVGVSLTSYSHMVQREPVLRVEAPGLSEGSARLLPASEHVSPLRNTAVWCR